MSKRTAFALLALLVVATMAVAVVRPSAPAAVEYPRLAAPALEGATTDADADAVALVDGPLTDTISGPIVGKPVEAISFDGDVRLLPQVGPEEKAPAREMGSPPDPGGLGDGKDPVIQGAGGDAAAPAPLASFAGLDLQNWGGGWPPDTHGDVGPNHYIQAVNTSIGIFDKATGARLAAFTFNNFFPAGTTCDTINYGDPIVLYDQVSGRWIITDFGFASPSSPPYYECIAVSKTADPVGGGWWLYGFLADSASMNDYPKLGVWSDGIYMSANMFKRGRTYSGAKVWALNRNDLISGAALRSVAFTLGTSYFSLLPSTFKGSAPPAGAPNYFLSDYGSTTSMKLWKFTVNWTTPSASTFTGPTSFSVASFTKPSSSVPQKSSSETLDTLGDRLMTWLWYRNVGGTQSLWVSRTAVAGSSTGIRWYEIRNMSATPSVYQQGTYAPDSSYRWMPSLAVDKFGNMAVGYSVSSSTMFPAIRYAGRLVGDALGTLGQTETSLIAGTGSQSGGYNRWGDYSSMSVDPVDDCTFWMTTEYYVSTGNNWQTRIGAFKFPGC